MKKQVISFLLLIAAMVFWFSTIGVVVMGFHFLFTLDLFSGLAFLFFGVICLIYAIILKKFPKLKELNYPFIDFPPFG